jgi:hypothetical protein
MGGFAIVLAVALLSGYFGGKAARNQGRNPMLGMAVGFLIPVAGFLAFKAMGPKFNRYREGVRHGQ